MGVLARFGNCHSTKHYEAALRVLRYLYTTKEKGIYFKYGDRKKKLNLDLYCDADFAGDNQSGKSTTGVIITINNTCILWSSKLQSCVSKNTMQAELIASNTGLDKLMNIKYIIGELGIELDTTPLHQDNHACRRIVDGSELKSNTRHMMAKYFYLKEQIDNGSIRMTEIDTAKQPADMMTKALNRTRLEELCKLIGLIDRQDLPNGGSEEVKTKPQ